MKPREYQSGLPEWTIRVDIHFYTFNFYSRVLKSQQSSWMWTNRLWKSRHDRVTAGSPAIHQNTWGLPSFEGYKIAAKGTLWFIPSFYNQIPLIPFITSFDCICIFRFLPYGFSIRSFIFPICLCYLMYCLLYIAFLSA